jgi:dTDP-4-dehydrorhamnose 3,5-epimerase
MKRVEELLPGCWLYRLNRFQDARGTFVKVFARSLFERDGVSIDMAEEFYSVSNKDVLRGMHFQSPPHDHGKVVYCAVGAVLDVLLDLRGGPGYGRTASVLLSEEEPGLIVIPKGVAHGFVSRRDGSLMVYKTSTEHSPQHDRGLRWDSFGFDWGCSAPVLSERDLRHESFAQFTSPF